MVHNLTHGNVTRETWRLGSRRQGRSGFCCTLFEDGKGGFGLRLGGRWVSQEKRKRKRCNFKQGRKWMNGNESFSSIVIEFDMTSIPFIDLFYLF